MIYFTTMADKSIHTFSDHGDGWLTDVNAIDRCSICGTIASNPVIVKDTFKFRTKYRTYTMCRVGLHD